MSEIIYKIRWTVKGQPGVTRREVSGYQVGRFAVRTRTEEDLTAFDSQGRNILVKEYLIDHVNSGIIVIDVDTFINAMVIADDLSRFSRVDPNSKEPQKVLQQIGPEVVEWLKWIISNRKVVGLRQHQQKDMHEACETLPQ